jgi:formylglycine-generating enzyme required for sulfatase activity
MNRAATATGQTSPGAYPRFWSGNDEQDRCRYANGTGSRDGYKYTSPAGHYQPNEFGLYDMAGNAWQWMRGNGLRIAIR